MEISGTTSTGKPKTILVNPDGSLAGLGATGPGATEVTLLLALARLKRLESFATITPIDISAADQTIAAGSTGLQVAVAGNIKLDCSGQTGVTLPAGVGLFHLAGITKIYKVGTTATVSFAGFPPA